MEGQEKCQEHSDKQPLKDNSQQKHLPVPHQGAEPPHFHCFSAGLLHEHCSPVSSAPSIFLSWESTKGWEKRRKETVPVLE